MTLKKRGTATRTRSGANTGGSARKIRKTQREIREEKFEKEELARAKRTKEAEEEKEKEEGQQGQTNNSGNDVGNSDSVAGDTAPTDKAVVNDEIETARDETAKESLTRQMIQSGATMGAEDFEALADRRTKQVLWRIHKFPFVMRSSEDRMKRLLRTAMKVDDIQFFEEMVWDLVKDQVKKTYRTKRSSVLESLQKMVIGTQMLLLFACSI